MERKQYMVNKDFIYPLSGNILSVVIKRVTQMATIKLGLILSYIIGIPMWIFAFITNMDGWKGGALFIVMMIYWMGMIWFGFRRKRRIERKEEIELWYQEKAKKEEMKKSESK